MTNLEKTILLELSSLPKSHQADVLTYIRFLRLGLASDDEIEKRFVASLKRIRVRAKKLKITPRDIEKEIRAVRAGTR